MNLLDIFQKRGINGSDDLNEAEKVTYRAWEAILNKPDTSISDLKTILPKELERANAELRNHESTKEKDSFYKRTNDNFSAKKRGMAEICSWGSYDVLVQQPKKFALIRDAR